MAGRPKGTRTYWADQLSAADQSGLSLQEYARKHGLRVANLYKWRGKLKSASKVWKTVGTSAQVSKTPEGGAVAKPKASPQAKATGRKTSATKGAPASTPSTAKAAVAVNKSAPKTRRRRAEAHPDALPVQVITVEPQDRQGQGRCELRLLPGVHLDLPSVPSPEWLAKLALALSRGNTSEG